MELLYVWIEEYKGITNLGFNISNRYDIKYENEFLEVKEYENWESRRNFYGKKVNNITALIGKNGSGKATLIDFISSVDSNRKGFMVYTDKNGENIYIEYINLSRQPVQLKEPNCFGRVDILELAIEDDGTKKILYYDNSINSYQVNRKSIIDISTSGLLTDSENSTVPFRSNDLKNMIMFLDETKSDIVLETMGFPTKQNDERHLMEKMDITLKITLVKENVSFYTDDIKENFINSFVHNTFSNLNKISPLKGDDFKLLMDISGDVDYNYTQKYDESKMKDLNNYPKGHIFNRFYNLYNELKELLKILDIESENNGKKLYFTISGKDSNPKIIKKFINFLEVAKDNSVYYHYFEYTWSGLSSGEEHFITFFSRIYSQREKLKEREKNILFILDEPETFLHPEWSRQFLKLLITFLDKLFEDRNLSIQLIISSHSPYLTSDMAREDIILLEKYLDKEEEKEKIGLRKIQGVNDKTLGANIHELYRGPFFMESTMGEFALNKIKEVIEDLTTLECFKRKIGIDCFNSLSEGKNLRLKMEKHKICNEKNITSDDMDKIILMLQRKENSKYIIDQIGERVLSRKLGEKYREIFGEEQSTEDKMKSLYSKLSVEEREALRKLGNQE